MKSEFVPIAIVIGFVAFFALGWGAGYIAAEHNVWSLFSGDPFRLQWEVIVGGAAAVFGGYMAYRGATEPHRAALRQAAIQHLIQFRNATSDIRQHIDEGSVYNVYFRPELSLEEVYEDRRKELQKLLLNLPETPEAINTPEADSIHSMIKVLADINSRGNNMLTDEDCNILVLHIDAYCDEIEKIR